MAKRAAAVSAQALKAAAIATEEAALDEEVANVKSRKKKRGPKSKVSDHVEGEEKASKVEERASKAAALAKAIQEAKNVVIDWDEELTWSLLTAIESDKAISDGLFPGVGAIKRAGGLPKTHFYQLLTTICFENHSLYMEEYAKATTPKLLEAWVTKIKNKLTTLVKQFRVHITEMGETGAGMSSEDDILPGTELTTKWDLIKVDSPWFFHVRDLIASRPNLQPVGIGNNKSDINTSILLPGHGDDTSSNFDDVDLRSQLSEGPDDVLSQGPDPSEPMIDVSSGSDNDMPEALATSVKRKALDAPEKDKPVKKKTKAAPATSTPAAAAPAVPKKSASTKDRFSATIVAEEETQQRALAVKKEKNDAKKEVALKKIAMECDVRLVKARSKEKEKKQKLQLAKLKMDQEHQYRMAQLQQPRAGPSSMTFSGGGSVSYHSSIFGMYNPSDPNEELLRLTAPDGAGPSSYSY
ncbi:hypothetical protein B0H17DRAFT_1142901 [Mycena rosella]|uniref:Uncharacterized protein n=1 Tax=Mycena rosella TaxID=1033263 RepID=A0AAD7CXL6_MYCRO|nr:hypothetical protein B0H17DRAFT_1142901 [Mycena rosella]